MKLFYQKVRVAKWVIPLISPIFILFILPYIDYFKAQTSFLFLFWSGAANQKTYF